MNVHTTDFRLTEQQFCEAARGPSGSGFVYHEGLLGADADGKAMAPPPCRMAAAVREAAQLFATRGVIVLTQRRMSEGKCQYIATVCAHQGSNNWWKNEHGKA